MLECVHLRWVSLRSDVIADVLSARSGLAPLPGGRRFRSIAMAHMIPTTSAPAAQPGPASGSPNAASSDTGPGPVKVKDRAITTITNVNSKLSVANIHPRPGSTAPPCPSNLVIPLHGRLVSVMQASEPRPRHSWAAWNLGYCRAAAGGGFLCWRVVRSIVVIVGDVLVQQSPEVALVEHDDLVEQLSAHTAYPTFRNAVLPRAPVRRSCWLQTERFHHGDHTPTEACIAIEHQVAQVAFLRECFSELLDDPVSDGVLCDIEMQNAPPGMINGEPDIQHAEGHGRDREEIHGRDRAAVMAQEHDPALERAGSRSTPRKISGHRAL